MASEVETVPVVVNGTLVVDEAQGGLLNLNGGDSVGLNVTTDSSASSSTIDDNSSASTASVPVASAPVVAPAAAAAPAPAPVPGPSSVPAPLPTYDDIFPALPGGLGGSGPSVMTTSGGPAIGLGSLSAAARLGGVGGVGGGGAGSAQGASRAPRVRSSNVTVTYRVGAEERRSGSRTRFGGESELSKICGDIMTRTGTTIQLTSSKDGTLNFLITGKEESANQARRLLSSEFQAQIVQTVPVPKEHHRILLGKGGKKLADLEQATGTKIQIPKQDDQSEAVRITGTRESIDKAVHEIQLISNEAFSRHIERIQVPKIFHPFIVGPFGRVVEAINKETGAKVNVPPASVQKDELSITGERNAVLRAKEKVLAIAEEKKKRCQTVSIEVKKPQHKYIVGPKGHTLNEIFEITGVSVEMPSPDSTLETIILRGEPDKLANALAVLYQKAHSETEDELEVPGWIQRHILGPKGVKFQELNATEFPKVNVSFEIEDNRIKMNGPVADVQKTMEILKKRADEIIAQLTIEEIAISDPKHIKFIVGKNGGNLKQIREETKASIQVIDFNEADPESGSSEGGAGGNNQNNNNHQNRHPKSKKNNNAPQPNNTAAQYIRIEGTRESVAKAKQELESLLKKLENEVSFELTVERRFYGQIIGAKGENIRDIRNKFNQVQIVFPEQNDTSEKVVVRGAKKDAEACYKYLTQLNKELCANNFRLEVPIFKQLPQFLQGKDSIKNIREESGARVDLPLEGGADVIVITGPKDKVEKARDRIQQIQSSLSDMSSVDIIIPARIHNYMLGSKGRNIKSIMAECGGVLINFPPEGAGSDKVQIRGPKEGVAKAKQLLVAMSNDYQVNNYTEELKVRVEHHRYLIGKNGSNINKLRDQTGVRVYFSSDSPNSAAHKDADSQEVVQITGKKEDVQKAKSILEEKIKELDKIIESEMHIDPKYHHLFVARRAAVCKQLYDEYGGVNVSFPPASDKTSDKIVLKGSKECVEAVKKRILEIVDDHDAQVVVEVEIDAQHHRSLLGPRNKVPGYQVNSIQSEFDVRIKFPARPKTEQQQQQEANGGDETPKTEAELEAARHQNIVTIAGRKENCDKAREALLALVPVTITVSIPYEYHRFVIGQKGAGVKDLMDRCNVNIRVPPSQDKSDIVSVTGTLDAVEKARVELQKKLVSLEGEKADREARNFHLTFPVDPNFHPKIIGKRGAVISKIRTKYDVQIQVPEAKGNQAPENADIITVIGYEKNANEAKEAILAIVKELEDLVTEEIEIDNRIHSRLIGSRGKNIRRVMDQYKVDIRFPKSSQNGEANADLVTITGAPDAVESAKEHLLETAESYLDDIEVQYQPPQFTADHQFQINFEELSANAVVKDTASGGGHGGHGGGGGGNKGFQVRGGPWEKKGGKQGGGGGNHQHHNSAPAQPQYDSSSAQDFPAFGGGPGSAPLNGGSNGGGLGGGLASPGLGLGGDQDSIQLNGGSAWGRKN